MAKVQFIKTPSGDELAVLPRADYERLATRAEERVEDIGTARVVDRARAAIAAGHEKPLPKQAVDRLAAGENPIRVLRETRGLTQSELALQAGMTQGYLSDLESGRRRGQANRLAHVANALHVPLDLLVQP